MNSKSKLLLVDDESAITDRLAPFLSRAGFEVKVVADGEAALREIVSYAPDLVVLDVLIPKLEDLETDYIALDLPEEIISEAKTILESFERIDATGTPSEEVQVTTAGAPSGTSVIAWSGHVASLPAGSPYDDMVVLSPEGTGEFGLVSSWEKEHLLDLLSAW